MPLPQELETRKGMQIAERKLRHNRARYQVPLGCAGCAERMFCGGLAVEANVWSCLSLCCGSPEKCDRVCRNNPDFAFRVQEIDGFALVLPQAPLLDAPQLPLVVPEVFHGSKRAKPFAPEVASISLYALYDRREGRPKYRNRSELSDVFKIATETPLLLPAIQRDRPLERWWEMGQMQRRDIIKAALDYGAVMATTPNYSLFLDRPRWDDMHAMKRIALAHSEFLEAGMPSALHVNGRTEWDFDRWAQFIIAHPEVTHVSFEFTTGTGRPTRRRQHGQWLCELAETVGRPLHLLVRGGSELLPDLCAAFAGVTFLETTTFLKTMMRFRAIQNDVVDWWPYSTPVNQPLDDLFETNWEVCRDAITKVMHRNTRLSQSAVAIA